MTTQDGQRDDGAPDVADATQDANETMQEPCPAEDCDSNQAHYEMLPEPGGSYDVRLFTSRRVPPQVARVLTAHFGPPRLLSG